MRQIGIFGGTFDPVHLGHLIIAEAALSQVPLEQVIWVPTRYPPHKQVTDFTHRCQMVQSAIASHPAMLLAPTAGNRATPSYAIHTLLDLKAVYPNTHWYWIIGLDAFPTLPRWYRRQELIPMCEWLVAPRLKSAELPAIATPPRSICEQVAQKLATENIYIRYSILHLPYVGISSSLIRSYCSNNYSIRYLVPESVRHYIASHNLYLPN